MNHGREGREERRESCAEWIAQGRDVGTEAPVLSEALAEALAEPVSTQNLQKAQRHSMARMRCAQAGNPTGYGAFLWLSRCAYELEQDSWAGLRRSVWA